MSQFTETTDHREIKAELDKLVAPAFEHGMPRMITVFYTDGAGETTGFNLTKFGVRDLTPIGPSPFREA